MYLQRLFLSFDYVLIWASVIYIYFHSENHMKKYISLLHNTRSAVGQSTAM